MWHVTCLPIVLLAEERVAKSFKSDPFSSGLPLKVLLLETVRCVKC